MKISNERVLAFCLATEMTNDELAQVSGGSKGLTYSLTNYSTNHQGVGDMAIDHDCD